MYPFRAFILTVIAAAVLVAGLMVLPIIIFIPIAIFICIPWIIKSMLYIAISSKVIYHYISQIANKRHNISKDIL